LTLDSSSKSYIHFIPKNLDFIPHLGEGWTKSKRILLFEIYNSPEQVSLYLIIGPGPQEIRQELYEIAKKNTKLFNNASRTLTEQWFSIYKTQFLKKKEIEDKEIDELSDIFKEKFTTFKKSELPEIEQEIRKYSKA
jgi:hypothetical protein